MTLNATPYFCYEFQIYDYTFPLSHGLLKTPQWQAAQIGEKWEISGEKKKPKNYPSLENSSLVQNSQIIWAVPSVESFSAQDSGLSSCLSTRAQESQNEVRW